ncbi:hypothetical protein, partial [Pandoraea nosoerga]|uniref:hypothetical protein n=1 Tax=Pandoraea nosoerga TaxID=2508296 RepID=UPI00197D50A7
YVPRVERLRGESVAPGQTNTESAGSDHYARGFRSIASTLLNDEGTSATGKQKAAVRLRLAFA